MGASPKASPGHWFMFLPCGFFLTGTCLKGLISCGAENGTQGQGLIWPAPSCPVILTSCLGADGEVGSALPPGPVQLLVWELGWMKGRLPLGLWMPQPGRGTLDP